MNTIDIDDRLGALERANQGLKWGLGVCAALVCVLFLRGSTSSTDVTNAKVSTPTKPAATKPPDVLRAHRLEIVDSRGQAVVILDSYDDKPLADGGGGNVFVVGQHGSVLLKAHQSGASVHVISPNAERGKRRIVGIVAREDQVGCTLLHDHAQIELVAGEDSLVRIERGDFKTTMGVTPKAAMFGIQQQAASVVAGVAAGVATISGTDSAGNVVFVQPTP